MTIPYSKGTSKTITRILHLYNIRVAHKPTTTLRHFPTNVKDIQRHGRTQQQTESSLKDQMLGLPGFLRDHRTEHKQATRNGDANNPIAVHHQLTNPTLTRTLPNA